MTKAKKPVEIDFNSEFQCALDMMEETDKNIIIPAGLVRKLIFTSIRKTIRF